MSSVGDTEVFIPEQARVITVPVHSLPPSITRKMSACPVHSNQLATLISPVELREKGTTRKPQPLTPGQILLPVVTSNRRAFRMLRRFLLSDENSLQFSDGSRAGSAFSKKKNSIVLFNTQIFLIVRKAKAPDWPEEQRSSTPSEHEAPPLSSSVKTLGGGSDITEGRSEEVARGAEDHGKCAEKRSGDGGDDVTECDAQDDKITDRSRSKDGTAATEDHGKCAKVLKEREADVMKDRKENELQPLMKDMGTSTSSPSERSRAIKLEEESGVSAPSLAANTDDRSAQESQITQNQTGNSNPELTSERGGANKTETHMGNEMSSSDDLKDGDKTKSSKDERLLGKAKCCKRLTYSRVQSPSLMNAKELQDKSDIEGQSSESEIPSGKMKASVSAAEIADLNNNGRVPQKIGERANKDVATSTSFVNSQTSEGQRSRCESAVEIIDINDDDQVSNISSDDEHESNFSKVENLWEKFKSLKRKLDDCVNSPLQFKNCERDGIVLETGADCEDLIIVESCAEVERVTAGSDTEVREVDGKSTDEPNRRVSKDKRQVNKTCAKAKRGSPVRPVASSSAEAKGRESAVEIIDVNDNRVLHKSTKDANKDTATCKSCNGAKSRVTRSPSVKRSECAVEIVDLNDDDDVNEREIVSKHRPRVANVANGCKRRIVSGNTDETDSGIAATAAAQISDVDGLLAKRSKHSDDTTFSSERKCLESAVNPNSQVRNHNCEVDIVEVDDDEDDESCRSANDTNGNIPEVESCANKTKVQRNRGNAEDSSDNVSSRERDGEILDLHGRLGRSQSSLDKIKRCKRRVSDNDSTDDVESQAQIIETEDLSAKRFKSTNVKNPGGKPPPEECATAQSSDQEDLINNKNSSKACVHEAESLLTKSDVEIVVHDSDQVFRKSTQVPSQDVTNSKNASSKNKSCRTAAELVDVHDDDRPNETIQTVTSVDSCVKSHVSEGQNESAAETVTASDERERVLSGEQNFDVTNHEVCAESYVSEGPSAAGDRALADKSYSDERKHGNVTTSEVSGREGGVKDALVEQDNDLVSASFTDQLDLCVTTSESHAEPQVSSSASLERCGSDSRRRVFAPRQDAEFADQQPESTNQSARGEEVGVLPRPTSPRANQEFDYVGLRREENINRIRVNLKGLEEKRNALMKSFH